jgi:uncharacterized damage-inducible protein DinB
MAVERALIPTFYAGWQDYQQALSEAIAPLNAGQLALRAAPTMRSVGEIAAHIVGARARWFHLLMGEGGGELAALGKWDRRGAQMRSASELIAGLETTWTEMQAAIARWSDADWGKTWPGKGGGEPEVITRQWVIWHLVEHDLHHGGEISITLGANGVSGVAL